MAIWRTETNMYWHSPHGRLYLWKTSQQPLSWELDSWKPDLSILYSVFMYLVLREKMIVEPYWDHLIWKQQISWIVFKIQEK